MTIKEDTADTNNMNNIGDEASYMKKENPFKNTKNEEFLSSQKEENESKEMTKGLTENDDGTTASDIEIEKRWRQLNNSKRKSKRKTFVTSIIRHKLKNKKTVYVIKQQLCEKRKDDAHIVILTKDDIMDLRGDL